MTVGSLFSGVGGLERAMESLGHGPTRWFCEKDPAARAVLRHHWPEVPCYEDVRDIDGAAPAVDLICGGFPCQPHSVAGKKQGTADARWLWPEFARVVAVLCPRAVFVENVPGLRTSGLRDVLADLARLGFDAEWGLFSAAQVGAPHRRNRLFLLAYTTRPGLEGLSRPRPQTGGRRLASGESRALDVADAAGRAGRTNGQDVPGNGERDFARQAGERRPRGPGGRGGADDGQALAHPDGGGRAQLGVAQPPRVEGEAGGLADGRGDAGYVHRFPPGPDRIGEWDGPEPAVRRVPYGVSRWMDRRTSRPAQLRLLGNAAVPQCAAFAFVTLVEQLARGVRQRT